MKCYASNRQGSFWTYNDNNLSKDVDIAFLSRPLKTDELPLPHPHTRSASPKRRRRAAIWCFHRSTAAKRIFRGSPTCSSPTPSAASGRPSGRRSWCGSGTATSSGTRSCGATPPSFHPAATICSASRSATGRAKARRPSASFSTSRRRTN